MQFGGPGRPLWPPYLHCLVRCSLPVCGLRVLFIIEWAAAAHDRKNREIVGFWRGIRIPFPGKRIPRIGACWLATAEGDNKMPEEHQHGCSNSEWTDVSEQVQYITTVLVR